MSSTITFVKKLLILNLGVFIGCSALTLSAVPASTRLIFECSRNPQTRVYSTIIKYSNGKTKELIYWKSTIIGNPQNTCRQVSDKFQTSWETGQLNYLITGRSIKTGRAIVCGVKEKKSHCNDQSKFFELLPDTNPKIAIKSLLGNINSSKTSSPIYQSSDDENVVDLQQLIK